MHFSLFSLPLRYFFEVARTGSVNQAAQRLHVAASAVSRQLSKLEDSVGVPLFERQPRGMALTAAGARLLAHLNAQEAQSAGLVQQLQDLATQQAQQVRVACTEGFAVGFLPRVMTLSAPTESWPLHGVRQVRPIPRPSHLACPGVSVT